MEDLLSSIYKPGDLIFIEDFNCNMQSLIEKGFKKLIKAKKIIKHYNKIYSYPLYSKTFKDLIIYPNFNDMIEKMFIKRNGKHFGYYCYDSIFNILNLNNQIPLTIEIASNIAQKDSEIIHFDSIHNITLYKPIEDINNENKYILQLVHFLMNKSYIKKIINNNKLIRFVLDKYIDKYNIDRQLLKNKYNININVMFPIRKD